MFDAYFLNGKEEMGQSPSGTLGTEETRPGRWAGVQRGRCLETKKMRSALPPCLPTLPTNPQVSSPRGRDSEVTRAARGLCSGLLRAGRTRVYATNPPSTCPAGFSPGPRRGTRTSNNRENGDSWVSSPGSRNGLRITSGRTL